MRGRFREEEDEEGGDAPPPTDIVSEVVFWQDGIAFFINFTHFHFYFSQKKSMVFGILSNKEKRANGQWDAEDI